MKQRTSRTARRIAAVVTAVAIGAGALAGVITSPRNSELALGSRKAGGGQQEYFLAIPGQYSHGSSGGGGTN